MLGTETDGTNVGTTVDGTVILVCSTTVGGTLTVEIQMNGLDDGGLTMLCGVIGAKLGTKVVTDGTVVGGTYGDGAIDETSVFGSQVGTVVLVAV